MRFKFCATSKAKITYIYDIYMNILKLFKKNKNFIKNKNKTYPDRALFLHVAHNC